MKCLSMNILVHRFLMYRQNVSEKEEKENKDLKEVEQRCYSTSHSDNAHTHKKPTFHCHFSIINFFLLFQLSMVAKRKCG